jgi:DNA-binding IclR family transcriptional regulator
MLLTIDSAGQVLSQFTTDCPERGVTEVALTMGISKSKAHALLSSLTHVGLLRRTHHGRYRLGWRVLSLNRVLSETTEFHRHARPVMDALGERCGEVVHLGVLDDGQVMYVDRIKGRHAVQIDGASLGKQLEAHCSAVGKVLLANTTPDELQASISHHGLPQITPRTITDRAVLERELGEVRRRGFALEQGEAVADVSCVAAPITAPGPIVVAAISIAAPSYRFTHRREVYTQMIVRAGMFVSQRLARAEEEIAREAHAEIAAAVADGHQLAEPLLGSGVSG